ncbi:MAG: GNAT family N-acetyltransferase [Bacteroidales bacterium]|jgi:ribosomal protein S18 acetylase RimI-like enzyme|nr:GNAT family N-acetyltransferase [Bacteroidales bacterium]
MHIQKAIPENLIEIMYLLRQCIDDFNKNNIYQWNVSYPDNYRLLQEIEKGSLYLMIHKGVPIGTITFDEKQAEVFDEVRWRNNSGQFIVIHRIAVFPTWQRKGVGQKLIEFVEKFAQENNFKSVRLDVSSSNQKLIELYERLGFDQTGDILYPKQKIPFKCLEKVFESV